MKYSQDRALLPNTSIPRLIPHERRGVPTRFSLLAASPNP
jgi:hypothetical protein